MSEQQRYPLSWPAGWKRTVRYQRKRAPFTTAGRSLTMTDSIKRLNGEMRRLGVRDGDWLISSNVPTRLDGLPYSGAKEPDDCGVAVYFRLKQQPRCLACDAWTRVADNIAAIAQHIDALRRIDRYGVGTLDQAFAGYAALPANTAANWRDAFGFPEGSRPTLDDVDEKFKAQARAAHPDAGGTHEQMARLTEARAFARKELTHV